VSKPKNTGYENTNMRYAIIFNHSASSTQAFDMLQ